MRQLAEQYLQSGQEQLTDEQRDALYEVTQGIPIVIKHCYGQIYEYSKSVLEVLRDLPKAGNRVVSFSFEEIFHLLKDDELHLRILLLLELVGRPMLLRQLADILEADEEDINERIATLIRFQCLTRSTVTTDEKFAINDEVRLLTAHLAQQHNQLATQIRQQVARLAVEKRMAYTREELQAFELFQGYLLQRQFVRAEEFIRDQLSKHPDSILLNLHHAKYLKELKRLVPDAIQILEHIRQDSGNDPQVLRTLMTYYTALEVPNFDEAHRYASELESVATDDPTNLDLARLYTEWSTTIKMKAELDPLKEKLRQQQYKELADKALTYLKRIADKRSSEYYYLLAQNNYNKWDYDSALRQINQAIDSLPNASYLNGPYKRLRIEILKKRARFASHV